MYKIKKKNEKKRKEKTRLDCTKKRKLDFTTRIEEINDD